MDVKQAVLEAEERIRPHIRTTPAEYSPVLSRSARSRVYLKLENYQLTGSFKIRGALSKFLWLSEEERRRGVVTASSGNHGAAVACLLQRFGCPGKVFLPTGTTRAKLDALQGYGAEIIVGGEDCVEAEQLAREEAKRTGRVYISPYNDPQVVGGQGTVGLELAQQIEGLDVVLAPAGGGGLLAGIAGYLKSVSPAVEIVGCQPANSCVLSESVKAGKILALPSQPTLSDGTAGGIEAGAITFDLCRQFVDDFVLVSEGEIKAAIRLILAEHTMLVEGSAALAVAAFLKTKERFAGKRVALVLSGAKLGADDLQEVLRD